MDLSANRHASSPQIPDFKRQVIILVLQGSKSDFCGSARLLFWPCLNQTPLKQEEILWMNSKQFEDQKQNNEMCPPMLSFKPQFVAHFKEAT